MSRGFSVRKAAQVVAFIVAEQGGEGDLIKTVKLVYMADRKFLELYDTPILNDELYCLENGPIDSLTYDYIKGQGSRRAVWGQYIKPRKDNVIRLAVPVQSLNFSELNRAEERVLRAVVKDYRDYTPFGLVDHIHQTCKEWSRPKGTSQHLSYSDVFEALGKDNPARRAKHVNEFRDIKEAALA